MSRDNFLKIFFELKNLKFIGIAIVVVLVVGGTVLVKGLFLGNEFETDIKKCNSVKKELRFSCYRAALNKYYQGNLEGLDEKLNSNEAFKLGGAFEEEGEVSYAVFGTNCHTFYHAVGDFIAQELPGEDVATSLNYCSSACTSGCLMGLYKRKALANEFSESILKEFYDSCRSGEEHQCSHEVGHLLHDKYFYPILRLLDEKSLEVYGMEQPRKYDYTTTNEIDFSLPFEDCRKLLPEDEWKYCFTGIGHNMFLFSEFSEEGYESMFRECDMISKENKEDCFAYLIYRIGINEAGPKFISSKPGGGIRVCEDAVSTAGMPDLKFHCYRGVGGGIGLYIDSEYLSKQIPEEKLSAIKNETLRLASLCDGVDKEYIDKCYEGLMGTRFRNFYELFHLEHDRIEELLPNLEEDFEVVG